jgi:hypothetical protein
MRFDSALVLAVFMMLFGGVAQAADPPAAPSKPAAAPKPLDLRVGNVRNYMMPNEFRGALTAPDAEKNTVIVEGERELLPMESLQPVPNSIIAPFWALAHPLQAWRAFVPDPNRPPPGKPDVVPPPIFRWGP